MSRERLVKPSDVIFTAVIAAAGILLWVFWPSASAGRAAVFRLDGEIVAELPLGTDAEYEITGAYTNGFEIRDGAVRVAHTDCPNRQCEKAGAISADGQSIVCAPNRVSVAVVGGEAGVDAVTG